MPFSLSRLPSRLTAGCAGLAVAFALVASPAAAQDEADGRQVVVLTDSAGFVHDVVKPPDGESRVVKTMRSVVEGLGGSIRHVSDAAELDAEVLDPEKTSAVVMYTTGDIPLDVELFNQYIEDGGALLGIHCATDTLMTTEAFYETIGGIFNGHPWNADTPVVLKAIDRNHPIIEAVGDRRALKEEIYKIKHFDPAKVRTLMVLDMEATELKQPELVPVVWCREMGKGRIVYTSLGHRDDVWRSGWFHRHLTAALEWATGRTEASAEPNPEAAAREGKLAREAFAESEQPTNQDRDQRRTNQPRNPAGDGASLQIGAQTDEEAGEAEEIDLFDGTEESAKQHWRGFKADEFPDGWQVEEDALVRADAAGDIVTREKFRDFELTLEWKVDEGGNSGVFYRVSEEGEGTDSVWYTGPEYQILDDDRHPDGRSPLTRAGSLYAMYPVPEPSPVNPAGEWNQTRIRIEGDRVQHFLNGEKTVDVEIGSEEWKERLAESKFADLNRFGTEEEGHIAIQDHGDRVCFRNIRIKRLD